jgi:tripartite motif-containing protein 71
MPAYTRLAGTAGLAAAALALGPGLLAAPASAGTISPVFERTIGGPGHAGLYAWGMATLRDGSVLVGDYWNYRVLKFNADGSPVGSGVFIKNNGNGATQYYTPYGLGQDPTNGEIYLADTDKYQIDVYSEAGAYLRSWGAKGSGPGKFLYPSRVVVNTEGTVYTADTWDNNIVISDRNGAEIKEFGGWGAKDGQIKAPHGMALDANNNLYVVDTGNWRISVFDKNGTFLRKWGTKGAGPGQFAGDMRGIAINKAKGWVYVVDGEGNKISKFDLNGNFINKWGSNGHGNGQFADGGREATVDAAGNLWVADMPNFRVQKFNGKFISSYPNPPQPPPTGGFNAPRGVAVNPVDGSIAVSDTYNWRIQTFTNAGAFVKTWGERGRGDYEFNYARLLAYSPLNQDIVIVDSDNGRVKAYTKDGVFKWSTGIAGKGGLGQFRNPQDLAIAADGTIFVADSNNQRVQVLSKDGALLRMFGSSADFTYNRGIAVDPVDGNIWVADSAKDQITKWSPAGVKLATLPIAKGTAENAISGPFGIAADAERIYVADTPTHSVKVYTKAGVFVTKIGSRGTVKGKLLMPDGIAVDKGKLYVMEEGNERISVFNLNAK